jgi:hypothetical protein
MRLQAEGTIDLFELSTLSPNESCHQYALLDGSFDLSTLYVGVTGEYIDSYIRSSLLSDIQQTKLHFA